MYKFEKLEVWQLALEYIDQMYDVSDKLPDGESFNLVSQMRRASTSVALNIAEGSTGQTDAEQARFLGLAIRSYIESVACLRIAVRRRYLTDVEEASIEGIGENLVMKLHAMRKSLAKERPWLREGKPEYETVAVEELDQRD